MENTLQNDIVDLQTRIATAIASITPDDVDNTYSYNSLSDLWTAYLQMLYFNF